MKSFDWDKNKSSKLKTERGISFEDIQQSIKQGGLLDTTDHPNKTKYPKQKMLVVEIDNYAYVVPYVENEEKIYLKTAFPSRKATKKYLLKEKK